MTRGSPSSSAAVDRASSRSPRRTSTREWEERWWSASTRRRSTTIESQARATAWWGGSTSPGRACWAGVWGGGGKRSSLAARRGRPRRGKPSLRLGGTIDYEARPLERPASWVTDAGLEWLYRLASEPGAGWRRYLLHQPPVLYHLACQ